MAALEGSVYQETRDRLAANMIMMVMFHQDSTTIDILDMPDDELAEKQIARRDESGRMQPTSYFMNACNRRFHQLEDANPGHKFTGPMHIGAVAEVILAEREHMTAVRRQVISSVSKKLGKDYGLATDATPAEVKAVFEQAVDELQS